MQLVFGAKASPLVILYVRPTYTTSLVGVSEFVVQAMETMREHPELLGESPIFFPRLHHTYHSPFRPVSVHAQVHQLLGPSPAPSLARLLDPDPGVFLPFWTLHRHG